MTETHLLVGSILAVVQYRLVAPLWLCSCVVCFFFRRQREETGDKGFSKTTATSSKAKGWLSTAEKISEGEE
jgi:hypothetical protein